MRWRRYRPPMQNEQRPYGQQRRDVQRRTIDRRLVFDPVAGVGEHKAEGQEHETTRDHDGQRRRFRRQELPPAEQRRRDGRIPQQMPIGEQQISVDEAVPRHQAIEVTQVSERVADEAWNRDQLDEFRDKP